MESHEKMVLDREQRIALLLYANQRLYEQGRIGKEISEAAKAKILLVK